MTTPISRSTKTRLEAAIDRLTGMKHRPTAIFSTFDDVAERIFLRLMRSGVSVPEDISLVSFGGAVRIGPMQQQLTAVTVDEMNLGKLAASLLHDMRSGKRPIESDDRIEIPLAMSRGARWVRRGIEKRK